jgi:phospholipase/carboxylesterase
LKAATGIEALPYRVRPSEGEPEGAVVLFHGRGTDEHDLFPLIDAIDPERRLAGITPRGPLALPPGGSHWYAVARVGYPHRETFAQTFELVSGWVDSLPEALSVPTGRTILGGFSQGAVMAYALGLVSGRPSPAGILALSGFLPTVDGFELDLEDRDGFRGAIGHGTYDPVIDVEFGRSAHQRLEAAGARVLYRESPMAHSIDPHFLPQLADWARAVMGGARSA